MKHQVKRSAFYRYALVVLAIMLTAGLVACGSSDDPFIFPSVDVAPIADAGDDQSVTTGDIVTLDGTASYDPNGDTITYRWIFTKPLGSTVVLSDIYSSAPTFTADVDGIYYATLIVNDSTFDSDPVSVTITALPAGSNTAPVANAGIDQSVTTGTFVTLDGSGSSDADGDTLTYAWTITSQPGTATLTGATTSSPTFTPDADGTYTISLVVNDGTVDSSADTMTVTASTGNSAPVANAGIDQSVDTGTLVTLDGTGSSDADFDTLTYAWTITSQPGTATLSGATTSSPTFTPDADGTYTISLVVNDGTVDSAADTMTVTASTAAPVADTFVFKYITYTESGSDPGIVASHSSADNLTSLGLVYGDGGGTSSFVLGFYGSTTGNYSLPSTTSVFMGVDGSMYMPDDGTYTYVNITISEYGAVGGRIKGTYAVTLCEFLALLSGTCDNPLNRETYVGSFDITRDY